MATATRIQTRHWPHFVPFLADLKPFRCYGALRGAAVRAGHASTLDLGRLPAENADSLRHPTTDYVVYSYATPIAWHNMVGWHMPDVKYSLTTTMHQHTIRTAFSDLGPPR